MHGSLFLLQAPAARTPPRGRAWRRSSWRRATSATGGAHPLRSPPPSYPPAEEGARPRLRLTPTTSDEDFRGVFEPEAPAPPAADEPLSVPMGEGPNWTWKDLLGGLSRNPTPQEQAVCAPFLERAIALLQPRMLLLVGAPSTKAMLKRDEGILSLRGRWFDWKSSDGQIECPALPTLHPAFLLRQPTAKKNAWSDLLTLAERLDRPRETWRRGLERLAGFQSADG